MWDEEMERHQALLVQHSGLLLEHGLEIMARREYVDCRVSVAMFGGLFIPKIDVRLGDLVCGWRQGWLRVALRDGGEVYATWVTGSALSGRHGVSGISTDAPTWLSGQLPEGVKLVAFLKGVAGHVRRHALGVPDLDLEQVLQELRAR